MDVQSQIDDLKGLVAKLKKNKECVPKEDLETKYKKAYNKLKADIKVLAKQITEEIINENLHFINGGEGRMAFSEIQDMVKKIGSEGESKKLGRCLTKEYDVEAFLYGALEIRAKVMEAYAPYRKRYEKTNRINEVSGNYGNEK